MSHEALYAASVADLVGDAALDLAWAARASRAARSRLEVEDAALHQVVAQLPRTSRAASAVAVMCHAGLQPLLRSGRLDEDAYYDLFLLGLFVFVVDDRFDEQLDPAKPDLGRALARHLESLLDSPAPSDDGVAQFLSTIDARFRRRPGYAAFSAIYRENLVGMLDGMADEFERGRRGADDLEAYLDVATRSLGLGWVLSGILVLTGEAGLARHPRELSAILGIASTAVRVANDLRSYRRELMEGKTTALLLAARQFDIDPQVLADDPQAVIRILVAMMKLELLDLRDALALIHTVESRFDEVVRHLVHALVELYAVADFDDAETGR